MFPEPFPSPTVSRRRLAPAVALAAAALLAPALAAAQDAVPAAEPAPGRIVYSREEQAAFDLWLADPDGTNETRLAEIDISAAGEDHPRWSPDGERVVFETTRKGDGLIALRVLPYTGGEATVLVEEVGFRGGDPDWRPGTSCVAFAGDHAGDPLRLATDLKTICLGEEDATVLDATPFTDERMPSWHPDGESLAFVSRSNEPEAPPFWSLWRMDADGANRRLLLDIPEMSVRYPRWSPDGRHIAFIAAQRDYEFGTLSLLDPETGAVTPLVERPAGPYAWSPDGASILFNNIADGGVLVHGGEELAAHGSSADVRDAAVPAAPLQAQAKGLYRLRLEDRFLSRLAGSAGGAEAKRFDFGYAPDWSPGTATPTPPATDTPTATATPTASATPTRGPTSTATATSEATPTGGPATTEPASLYLPLLLRGATLREAEADEPNATATFRPPSTTQTPPSTTPER